MHFYHLVGRGESEAESVGVNRRQPMSEYLPTPADAGDGITPIESQGRYAVATFELFQASTDALDDLASHAQSERTTQGYRSDWRQFRAWAGTKGIEVPVVTADRVDRCL